VTLEKLEPRAIWTQFEALAAIPRPSKHEERAAAYVMEQAKRRGREARRDGAGNVLVRVPATRGREKAPPVVLQGHLDMVCEKNRDVAHDFMKDPIRPRIAGEYVTATGTTLGADNGIGVAAALAVLASDDLDHGPLELLFTVDEETGLTGASRLEPGFVTGRRMLNLDSEDDGVLYIGCAGGRDSNLTVVLNRAKPPARAVPVSVSVEGLRGGHSGVNIHENRGNALKLLARVLLAAEELRPALVSLEGGDKHNAIPREATALVWVTNPARLVEIAARMVEGFRTELEGTDDGVRVVVENAAPGDEGGALESADHARLVRLLGALPHGVLAMSGVIPGMVETSNNLAVARLSGKEARIVTSSRSSVASSLEGVLQQVRAAALLAGADVETTDGYPGWKPNPKSPLLESARQVHKKLRGNDPQVTAIHAGLECGIIGQRIPGMDMISFGPQIEGAHSPEERVRIPSVAAFWEYLRAFLKELAG
jgi:dipeptidase D